jgi:hypothetical protein
MVNARLTRYLWHGAVGTGTRTRKYRGAFRRSVWSSGLDRFSTTWPERFFNAGIAEQNIWCVAAGLAASGFIPFVTSFPNFLTLRSRTGTFKPGLYAGKR